MHININDLELNLRPFDTDLLLKKSKGFDEEIQKLQKKLDAIPELPAVNNESGIRGSEPSDPTGKLALRRMELIEKINEINLYKEMLECGLSVLTDDERIVINGFYFGKKRIRSFVWEYGRKHGLCKDYVYKRKNEVLRKMGDFILKNYY